MFFATALAGNCIEPSCPRIRIHCQLQANGLASRLVISLEGRGSRNAPRASPRREDELADLMTMELQKWRDSLCVSLTTWRASPRRDGLDLLNIASTSIIELIGSGAANAALDDIADLWP